MKNVALSWIAKIALGCVLPLVFGEACSGGFNGCRASRTCNGPPAASNGGHAATNGGAAGASGLALGGNGAASGGVGGNTVAQAGDPDGGMAGEAGQGGEMMTPGSHAGTGNVAGDAGSADASGAGGEREMPDTTPPTIVSIFPEDGAHAVRIDADVVVTFSEPMDEPETEASFECDAFLPSHTTFSWSDDGTVMIVHSPGSLEYAEPWDPTQTSAPMTHSYSFTITTFGRDRAGNHLTRDENVTFDTGHTYNGKLALVDARIIRHVVPGSDQIRTPCIMPSDQMTNNEALLLTFSFDAIPQLDSMVDWKSASLTPGATDTSATMQSLEVGRVLVNPADLSWDVPIIEEVERVAELELAVRPFDATDGVRDDFVNRATRSDYTQYLIRFADTTAAQNAPLTCGASSGLINASLEGEYVAP